MTEKSTQKKWYEILLIWVNQQLELILPMFSVVISCLVLFGVVVFVIYLGVQNQPNKQDTNIQPTSQESLFSISNKQFDLQPNDTVNVIYSVESKDKPLKLQKIEIIHAKDESLRKEEKRTAK